MSRNCRRSALTSTRASRLSIGVKARRSISTNLSPTRALSMGEHKRRIVWSLQAVRDLRDIWRYLATAAGVDVADEQLRNVDSVCGAIADWSEYGRKRDHMRADVRSVRSNRYLVYYRVLRHAIEVVRVLDDRRDVQTIFNDSL